MAAGGMNGFLAHARQALAVLATIEIWASVSSLVVICILALSVVVARQFLGTSILWAEEVSLLLMKIVVFLGAAGIYASRSFIVVDGLVRRAPPNLQRTIHLLNWLVVAIFASVVVVEGVLTYPSQIAVRSYLLELPKFYFMVPLIAGAGSIALFALYYFVAILTHPAGATRHPSAEADVAILAADGSRR